MTPSGVFLSMMRGNPLPSPCAKSVALSLSLRLMHPELPLRRAGLGEGSRVRVDLVNEMPLRRASLGEGSRVRVVEHPGLHNVGVGHGPTLGQVLDLPLQSRTFPLPGLGEGSRVRVDLVNELPLRRAGLGEGITAKQ
jgi:hypothetical protein